MEVVYIIAIIILAWLAYFMPSVIEKRTVAKLEANRLLKEKVIFYKDDKIYRYFLEKYKNKIDQK